MRNDAVLYACGSKRFPKAVDVYGQRIIIHERIALPKAEHDFLPAHNPARPFKQRLQNPKLIFRERDAHASAHKARSTCIEHRIA